MNLICAVMGIVKTIFLEVLGFCLCDYLPIIHQLFPCQ
jgi:hypothetical protein